MLKEESGACRKQATRAKRLQALSAAKDVLYAALGRLGLIEGARGETNA